MAAISFHGATLVLPGPPDSCSVDARQLESAISYQLDLNDKIETLSTKGIGDNNGILGLLYVPEFPSEHSCNTEIKDLIPKNVTHRTDLPTHGCRPIALAPWVSESCTLSMLGSAAEGNASAFVFYRDEDSSDDLLPSNDDVWKLTDDDGWKSEYDFPIYAIPGSGGQGLMRGLAQYSGSVAETPHADALAAKFKSDSFIRLYASIEFERDRRSIPELWVFLLAVIAILVGVMLTSSLGMRCIQVRRRRSLHRRIAAGEVDLEMLGIKRIRVPQQHLDKMPLYTYAADGHPVTPAPTSTTTPLALNQEPKQPADHVKSTPRGTIMRWLGNGLSSDPATASHAPVDHELSTAKSQAPQSNTAGNEYHGELVFSQLTCPICLDDYVPEETTVRELPCRHIFHPECIDTFLLQNSSLCPVCKETVLPPGYFPEIITDTMVRQERFARRVQRHGHPHGRGISFITPATQRPTQTYPARQRMSQPHSALRTALMSHLSSPRHPDTRANRSHAVDPPSDSQPTPPSQTTDQPDPERREEMRRRAVAMLGPRQMAEDEVRETDNSRPKCESFP